MFTDTGRAGTSEQVERCPPEGRPHFRSSMAYFAGAGTVIAAIVGGVGGGFLIADMISPKSPKQAAELTRLERRMSPEPIQATVEPAQPAAPTTQAAAQEQTATQQTASSEEASKPRDADVKRTTERRRVDRRQQWTERRRYQQRQDQDLRAVEDRVREETEPRREFRVREETEPRREFAVEPERIETPRIRLFGVE